MRTDQQVTTFEQHRNEMIVRLQTPRVPGELEDWLEPIRRSALATYDQLQLAQERVYPDQYAEIIEQDPELHRHVELLKEADAEHCERFQAFLKLLDKVASNVPEYEPDEATLENQFEYLVQEGLNLALALQQHEIAIRTWMQEAVNRDRGVAD